MESKLTPTMELDKTYIAGTYARFPLEIVSGKGSLVKDTDGKEYIDMGSGIAVTSFGAADDAWVAAVEDQIHKVQHMSNLYYTGPCARLAEILCRNRWRQGSGRRRSMRSSASSTSSGKAKCSAG